MHVAKSMNISCRTISGEAFIFNQETRELIKLDKVGSFIWDQIDGIKTIQIITENCIKTFEGDEETIKQSVEEFIRELCNKNVAVLATKPFPKEMTSVC